MLRRALGGSVWCVLLLSVVTACSGSNSSGAIDVPSRTTTFSPTGERPTRTTTPDSPDTSEPAPTSPPAPAATSVAPASAPPTSTAPPQPTSAATPETTTAESDSAGGGWWWLLILVLALGAVIAWLLLRHAPRRRAWEARLATAERETGWFARDLIPQLRGSGSPAGVSGGWAVAAPRVAALDDQLTQLVSTALGPEERARASALRDAVRSAREKVLAVVNAGETPEWALDLDDAQTPLLAVLVPSSTTGSGAPSGE
jgi:hypothetical protein